MINQNIILIYSRHQVPKNIWKEFQNNIEYNFPDTKILYVDGNNNFYPDNLYVKSHENYAMDLYLNLQNVIKKCQMGSNIFLFEPDVIYPSDYIESGEKSIKASPSLISSNKNFIQRHNNDFRKYPSNMRIFSSLCAKRDIFLKHIKEKITEFNSNKKVAWLEPGYHANGQTYFAIFKTDGPCIELRHSRSSTALGTSRSGFIKFLQQEENKEKQIIGVMCPLANFTATYSVAKCVYDQLLFLCRKYKEVVFFTTDDFKTEDYLPDNLVIRKFPSFLGEQTAENCSMYTIKNYKDFAVQLQDVDFLITHDIIFIDGFKPFNSLLRTAIENNDSLKMIHYIHSAPSVVDRSELKYPEIILREPIKNSKYISLNKINLPMLAEMYLIDKNDIIYAPNTIDPCINYNFHPMSREIYYEQRLWDYDLICTYPARLVGGKQQYKLIRLLAQCKEFGIKVKIILLNSYLHNQDSKDYQMKVLELVEKYDLQDNVFLSNNFISKWAEDEGFDLSSGVPHDVVRDMLLISDLFILPSVSEGCSLIMLEAALSKNAIVLNDDLETLKDFGGKKNSKLESKKAEYLKFGSVKIPTDYYDEDNEWNNMAVKLLNFIQSNASLNFFRYVRKFHSPDFVFENILEPHIKNHHQQL